MNIYIYICHSYIFSLAYLLLYVKYMYIYIIIQFGGSIQFNSTDNSIYFDYVQLLN